MSICEWNCLKLAEALNPVMDEDKLKEIVKANFKKDADKYYMEKMSRKVK